MQQHAWFSVIECRPVRSYSVPCILKASLAAAPPRAAPMPRASEERGPAVKLGLVLEVLHQGFGLHPSLGTPHGFARLSDLRCHGGPS